MLSYLAKPVRSSRSLFIMAHHMSEKRTLKVPLRSKSKSSPLRRAPAPAANPLAVHDAWTEVVDKESGQIYYWNTVTDETTALGAPKPNGVSAPAGNNNDLATQQAPAGGMMSGLGGVMAQGFAFGVGSSVAHSVVGSMFGGSSSHSDDSGGGGDDGSFDV